MVVVQRKKEIRMIIKFVVFIYDTQNMHTAWDLADILC